MNFSGAETGTVDSVAHKHGELCLINNSGLSHENMFGEPFT